MFAWFENRLKPFPEEALKKPAYGLVAFCLHYSKGVWPWLGLMALFTALIAVIEVSLFGFLGRIVDWLNAYPKEVFFQTQGTKLIAMGVLVLVILPTIVAIHSLLMHQTLLGNYPMRIRWLMHRYLLGQSLGYFQNESSGRISAKVMQTALAVRETVMKLFDVLNYIIVYFSGTLVIAGSSNWRLMIPFVVWCMAYISLLFYFIPRLQIASKEQADARTVMTGRVIDSYANITTVKLFSHNAREEAYARRGFEQFQATVNKQMRLISQFSMSVYFVNSALLFAVGVLGLFLWQHSGLAVGAVAVGIGLALRLNGMAQWIMWEMAALFENIGIVEDGMRSIAQDRLIEDKKDAATLHVDKGHIVFKNVGFGYNSAASVLKDFNLEIKPGEKVGIVGRSGAGKSTLVHLLLRFYDVKEGGIFIDGKNISQVTQESLRANIGMVTQDTALLHRSLRENVLYGRPQAAEEELLAAMENAQAAQFVAQLSDHKGRTGYEAHVGERGARLSGGQRQRIAIARVMLKDAPILILDEATSALDSEAELAIQNNLKALMYGKTVLAIAHRLSTIAEMDRLIVMDKGRIVEDGTHETLLKREGLYASLWQRQVGGHLILDEAA